MRPFIFFRRTFFTGIFLYLLMGPATFLLAKEPLRGISQNTVKSLTADTSVRHYKVFFSMGFLPGSMEVIQTTPISLGMSHGYYNKGIFTGIGMAVENFEPAFFPVFADVRFFPGGKQCRPYVRGILGKNFVIGKPAYSSEDTKTQGKIVTGIGGGISYPVGLRTSFFFYLGYRYMKYTSTYNQQNPVEEEYTFNRLEFRLGISF